MSQPELLRELQLPQAHLSAASALVRVAERLFVVADDELHLGLFDLGDPAPGRLVRLFEGSLPAEKKARKAAKPDLEALALLPAMADFAQGALLALGSGSTPDRQRGVLLGLTEQAAPRLIDLAPLYRPLHAQFADLNIEGGFLLGDEFLLLQRGNQGRRAMLPSVMPGTRCVTGCWVQARRRRRAPSSGWNWAKCRAWPWALPMVPHWPMAAGCSAQWPRTLRTATTTEPAWGR